MSRIYTRTGDDGTTGLGDGSRAAKDAARVAAYGTVDELNCQIGVALAVGLDARLEEPLRTIQSDLLQLGSELCMPQGQKASPPAPAMAAGRIEQLEELIDNLTGELTPLANFILPGGSQGAALLHLARTVCRRAERQVVTLAREEGVRELVLRYLNRLSDALFVMARYENRARGIDDLLWIAPSG
jgi:cob(I)alamin adenosyltransferase